MFEHLGHELSTDLGRLSGESGLGLDEDLWLRRGVGRGRRRDVPQRLRGLSRGGRSGGGLEFEALAKVADGLGGRRLHDEDGVVLVGRGGGDGGGRGLGHGFTLAGQGVLLQGALVGLSEAVERKQKEKFNDVLTID